MKDAAIVTGRPTPPESPGAADLHGRDRHQEGPRNVVIMGAAGRDFHNFNMLYRHAPEVRVLAFTAAQIPDIAGRNYPAVLAGPAYPEGIPVIAEEELSTYCLGVRLDEVVFAYSDVSHEEVMHKASRALACGADFTLVSPSRTMLVAHRPVVAVCAVRTGCGKSPVTRHVADTLRHEGLRVVVVRHPMPYGDLAAQAVQRFASVQDMDDAHCTIEEREEYEHLVEAGLVVYAGVDYERILAQAEAEADVIIWDGGNNDTPFFRPDVHITLCDALRPGHEVGYHPGETNLRMAHIVVVNKADDARPEQVARVCVNAAAANPGALLLGGASRVTVDTPDAIAGKRVLVVEDGPTLTHGGMPFGAASVAARVFGAAQTVDPWPHAAPSLRATREAYPHLDRALPAMGYSPEQVRDLADTISATPCDLVLSGTPVDLARLIVMARPHLRVRYTFEDAPLPCTTGAPTETWGNTPDTPETSGRPDRQGIAEGTGLRTTLAQAVLDRIMPLVRKGID
ncbi:cyclic 2,3-diphosphoglycerate synthase [Nitratidesulfovibrio vulgaris]|uniref:cyclic 2,3-diphosphoglycerate synthase n=1 Tax=Nitratidesulfovibrio vulgaris TaxID=881 RepID=UPI0013DFB9A4|nr:GTPase [Nitratidesulfovibrio vulgaris]